VKKLNKIFAAVISAAMLAQTFIPCVLAETSAAVAYTFDTQTAGIADGTITVSGIPADATKVRLYWGSDATTALSDYSDIKTYTSAETVAYYAEALALTDGALSYEVEGSRYIPENANYIIAEITNADGTLTTVSQELANKGFGDDNMLYSMFWTSDTHMRWVSYKDSENQSKAFNVMRDIADKDGSKFKGVIINGDIADSAKDYEYGLMEQLIDKTLANDYPVYYNEGNHDGPDSSAGMTNFVNARDYRFEKLKAMGYTFNHTDKWSYDTYIGGQHYIFFATPYGSSYTIGDAQYEWLEAKLSESDRSGVKSYVFSHLTVKDTVPGSSRSGAFNKDNEEFAAIMARHPNTVVMTSHIHLDMDTDMKTVLANADTASYMDTSSLYYTNTYPNATDKGVSLKDSNIYNAYGRYAQIYADKIVVRTMNFKKNKWVPRAEYVIPVNNSVTFEGTPSVSNSGEGLAVGNVLTAKLNGSDVDTSKYSCEWFISGTGSVGTDATYTIATADKNVSLKLTDKATGAYAYATTGYYSYTAPEEDGETEETLTPPTMTDDNTVVENDDVVFVTGNVGTANAGKDIMLVVIPKTSYNNAATIKYINEVKVGADGGYTFKFKADGINTNDFLMAKLEGKDVTNSIISVKAPNVFGADMSMTLSDTNVPSLSITNKYLDAAPNTKLIIATYDANKRLIKADVTDWDMAFGAYGEAQKYTGAAVEGTTVKAFLFRDFETLEPLAQSVDQSITVTQTSETETE